MQSTSTTTTTTTTGTNTTTTTITINNVMLKSFFGDLKTIEKPEGFEKKIISYVTTSTSTTVTTTTTSITGITKPEFNTLIEQIKMSISLTDKLKTITENYETSKDEYDKKRQYINKYDELNNKLNILIDRKKIVTNKLNKILTIINAIPIIRKEYETRKTIDIFESIEKEYYFISLLDGTNALFDNIEFQTQEPIIKTTKKTGTELIILDYTLWQSYSESWFNELQYYLEEFFQILTTKQGVNFKAKNLDKYNNTEPFLSIFRRIVLLWDKIEERYDNLMAASNKNIIDKILEFMETRLTRIPIRRVGEEEEGSKRIIPYTFKEYDIDYANHEGPLDFLYTIPFIHKGGDFEFIPYFFIVIISYENFKVKKLFPNTDTRKNTKIVKFAKFVNNTFLLYDLNNTDIEYLRGYEDYIDYIVINNDYKNIIEVCLDNQDNKISILNLKFMTYEYETHVKTGKEISIGILKKYLDDSYQFIYTFTMLSKIMVYYLKSYIKQYANTNSIDKNKVNVNGRIMIPTIDLSKLVYLAFESQTNTSEIIVKNLPLLLLRQNNTIGIRVIGFIGVIIKTFIHYMIEFDDEKSKILTKNLFSEIEKPDLLLENDEKKREEILKKYGIIIKTGHSENEFYDNKTKKMYTKKITIYHSIIHIYEDEDNRCIEYDFSKGTFEYGKILYFEKGDEKNLTSYFVIV